MLILASITGGNVLVPRDFYIASCG